MFNNKNYDKEFFTADFETTACDNPQVYSWGLYSNEVWEYGICIKSFLKRVLSFDKSVIIYFHNGAKFDFKFILPVLQEIGLRQRPYTEGKKIIKVLQESRYKVENIGERSQLLEENEFEYFADGTQKIFNIKIGLKAKTHHKDGKNHTVEFRDSRLLFDGSIKSYGDSLNSHYDTYIYTKGGTGSITYDRTTLYKSIDELYNDEDELDYLKQDCVIAYEFLKLMSKVLPMKWWKLTSASTAYNYWKDMFGKQLLIQAIRDNVVKKVYLNKKTGYFELKEEGKKKLINTRRWKNKEIKKYFPTGWLNKLNGDGIPLSIEVNNFYNGGLTWINPRFKGLKLPNVKIYDRTSAYPAVMASDELLPWGEPFMGDGGKDYPLKLINIHSRSELYNNRGLPFVFKLGKFSDDTKIYAKKLPKNEIFKITEQELERFKKHYEGDYDIDIYMSFRGIKGSFFFKSYIDKFFQMKAKGKKEGDIAKTSIAKLFLNALYGKFGTKTTREGRIYNFDTFEWENTRYIEKAGYFLPMAIYITAINRMSLVDSVADNHINTIGGDTDSIFVADNNSFKEFNFEIHPTKLGAWKLEYEGAGIFKRSKQYLLHKDKIVTAGINWDREFEYIENNKHKFTPNELKELESNLPTINNFCTGIFAINQTAPIQFQSGIQIVTVRKYLAAIWEDASHEEDWFYSASNYAEQYKEQLNKVMKQEF